MNMKYVFIKINLYTTSLSFSFLFVPREKSYIDYKGNHLLSLDRV